MRDQMLMDERTGSESSAEDRDEGSDSDEQDNSSSGQEQAGPSKAAESRTFFGWDEDDDDMSEDEDEHLQEAGNHASITEVPAETLPLDKGKGKAAEQ
jgi:hypothetical protein